MVAFLNIMLLQLMVSAALILLTARFPTMVYIVPVALKMCREIGVSALREWMSGQGLRDIVKVGKMGKLKTACQMISTTLLLMVIPDNPADFDLCLKLGLPKPLVFSAGITTLYLSTAFSLLSGMRYLTAAMPFLTNSNVTITS